MKTERPEPAASVASPPSAATEPAARARDPRAALRGLDFAAQEAALRPGAAGAAADAGAAGRGFDTSSIVVSVASAPKEVPARTGYGFCQPTVSVSLSDAENVKLGPDQKWHLPFAISVGFLLGTRHPPGKVDVATAQDAAITKGNAQQARADLTPDGAGYAPRRQFFASALSKRHEQVHLADYVAAAERCKTQRLARLAAMSGAGVPSDRGQVVTMVTAVLQGLEGDLIEDYAGPGKRTAAECLEVEDAAAYCARPGEARAFGDGRPHYQKLADDIGARFGGDAKGSGATGK